MPSHIVQQGECISSIAFAAGFLPETLWDLPENADLKSLRKDLNILHPGDVVEVPELRLREEDRPTGARHSFVKKGVPALIRLQVFDGEKPRANQEYTLTIDGV